MPRIYVSPSSQQANIGPDGYNEEVQMNLVADILCPELTRHGIEWMRNKTCNDYSQHVAESNLYMKGYVGAKYHLAIHTNAGGGHGCTSFCYRPLVNNQGTQFATNLYDQIIAISPWAGRGVRATTMDEVEKTNVPACLIEIEFHDNLEGATWIRTHIAEIAQALLLGILKQLNIEYIPPVDYKKLYEETLIQLEEMTEKYNDAVKCVAELTVANAVLQTKIDEAILVLS